MQFFILFIGVMVFVFFQFNPVPLNFNPNNKTIVEHSIYKKEYDILEQKLSKLSEDKKEINLLYIDHLNQNYDNPILRKELVALSSKENDLRDEAREVILKADSKSETNDKDYVFIHFILHYLPKGLIGLLLAVILSAAMSSTASGISALASTTAIDIYKRNVKKTKSERHFVSATKFFTILWGLIAILFACIGTLFENLIQLVNIVGSIFYGTVLGIFLVGFYIKFVKAKAIFWGAVISQLLIFYIYYLGKVSFLWLNFIGAMLTIVLSIVLQMVTKRETNE
jgi:Na+(H+)/acetate symporter ActP